MRNKPVKDQITLLRYSRGGNKGISICLEAALLAFHGENCFFPPLVKLGHPSSASAGHPTPLAVLSLFCADNMRWLTTLD